VRGLFFVGSVLGPSSPLVAKWTNAGNPVANGARPRTWASRIEFANYTNAGMESDELLPNSWAGLMPVPCFERKTNEH